MGALCCYTMAEVGDSGDHSGAEVENQESESATKDAKTVESIGCNTC